MTNPDKAKPVRQPVQKRSIDKRNRILQAARTIINESGYNELTTHKVAELAGVSVGTIYSYFRNKREIFLEIARIVLDEIYWYHRHSFEKSIQEACSLEEAIELVIKRYKQEFDKEKILHKELSIQSYLDEEFRSLYLTNYGPTRFIMDRLMAEYPDEVNIADYDTTVFLLLHTAGSVIHYLSLFGAGISEEVVLRDLTRMMYRFIAKPPA